MEYSQQHWEEKFEQLRKKILYMSETIWRPDRGESNWSATFLLDEIREEWEHMKARLHYLEQKED